MDLEVAKKNLSDFVEILDNAEIRHWLMMGTFLGAYRDHAIIPYDEDVDIAIYAEDLSVLLARPEIYGAPEDFRKFAIQLFPRWVTFHRNGEQLDVYLFRLEGNKRTWYKIKYDTDAFETYNETEFLGRKWRILNEPERWLEYTYGKDWRTPIKGKTCRGVPRGGNNARKV